MNDEARMTNDEGMTKSETPRDEFDEAFWNDAFGEAVIDFARTIPQNAVTNRIVNQLVGAGTSVGANYVKADDAVSKKEFLKSIGTCKKEAREAKHFLRMAVRAAPELKPEARKLWLEARELHLIFSKIWRSGKNERRNPMTNNQGITFAIRASSFFRHSSFVIRHCLHHA